LKYIFREPLINHARARRCLCGMLRCAAHNLRLLWQKRAPCIIDQRFLSLLLLFCLSVQAAGSGGINAPDQQDKPYLILISIDGFRWDFLDQYATPALDRIAASGVRAEEMIPVFPTLTFPNHYSIATGLYPANHGLIGNRFPSRDRKRFYSSRNRETVQDGSWYGGVPIWLAAERSGMVTAAFFFVGTEAAVADVPMSHWHVYDAKISGQNRVTQVLDWLQWEASERPHLITLYFEDVDTATHDFGPGSPQSAAAIGRVDRYMDQLVSGIGKLPIADKVYLVIVSDHGQSVVRQDEAPMILDTIVDFEGLTVVDHGAVMFIYLPEPDPVHARQIRDAINASWEHGRAMLKEESPAAWNISGSADFAEVIVQADPGFTVYSSSWKAEFASAGDHGWAPEFRDMHGIFIASGPRLPSGLLIPPIRVVDVYPLMREILGLPVTSVIDSDPTLLPALLAPE